ncbi:Chitinase 1 [Gamsiella multidivaricata]|nr:Chitinase 1 [Gamsiella multidivaricata]
MPRLLLGVCANLALHLVGLFHVSARTFNPQADNNLVNYWGQKQKPIGEYCQSQEAEDVIVVAFLHVFNIVSKKPPRMDFANQCAPTSIYPGTSLMHCPRTGAGIKLCQSEGKVILLSLGGAAGAYGFANDAEAREFAHTIWNLFLGGSAPNRPLDDAILDGVDLDIEGGSPVGYPAFIAEIRSLFATDLRKQYYISAAPQCPFPDAYLGATLQSAWIDMVFVQFYNNVCGAQEFGTSSFNYEQWDNWAKTTSVNKNVRIYFGVPASQGAANAGYVTHERLSEIVDSLRCKYSSFGGVMLWDVSQAYGNFNAAGIHYSLTAAQGLKRPRKLVCGEQSSSTHVPTHAEHTHGSRKAGHTLTQSDQTGAHPPLGIIGVPTPQSSLRPEPPLNASRTNPPRDPLMEAQPSPPPPECIQLVPDARTHREESICPFEGGECRPSTIDKVFVCDGLKFAVCVDGYWILRDCAPETYCTPHGCELINGPVKSCREMEQKMEDARTMRQRMRDVIDRMWSTFGASMDSTWANYLGLDHDALQQHQSGAQDKPGSLQADIQHVFDRPGAMDNIKNNTESELVAKAGSYLIDFVKLNPSPEFVNFTLDHNLSDTTIFRTQVRIRTNGAAISPLWRASFYLKSGQIVRRSSRGTMRQNETQVLVTSDPNQETEQSMVIRFVIEGIKDMNISKCSDGGECDTQYVYEASSLPDPASARFDTIPFSIE